MGELLYGLLGRKLGHSWSVPIHRSLGCDSYRLCELEPEELGAFLRREDLGGVNVTIPYKREVIPFCDWLDEGARAIGSVNTIVRGPDGKNRGYNTDLAGFRLMAQTAGADLAGKKVVVLGDGGASLTVQAAARMGGARQVAVISRRGPERYEDLPRRHGDADILVNATPVGMWPQVEGQLADLRDFPRLTAVLDLIYNPLRTDLLLQAEALKIPCCGGLPMLVEQAAAAEELFFGRKIPRQRTEAILSDLRRGRTNLVLVGMPGSGKTTVGRELARISGRSLLDLDAEIVRQAGRPIPDIFREEGEAAFRALEGEVLAKAAANLSGWIIATGGGAVLREENRRALRRTGWVCFLHRGLEKLPVAGRPLSQSGSLEEMYRTRLPLYRAAADAEADNDNNSPEETARAIWRDFCAHSGD